MKTKRRDTGLTSIVGMILIVSFAISFGAWGATLPAGLHKDIEYCKANGEPLMLDAFVPEGEDTCPIAILVHGGGWASGHKKDMHFLCDPLIKSGFTCFSVGYRLAPEYRWPTCLNDILTAIKWVKTHAAQFKGDPKKIALIGYSAGGHLVCMAAVQEPVNAVVGFAPPTDHLADSKRRGGLSESMQKLLDRPREIDDPSKEMLEEISPINHVSAKLPPYLLIHGTEDQSVPYEQSIAFQAKQKANDVTCDLITIEGAPHRISDWDKFGIDYRQEMVGWLWRILGMAPQQAATENADTKIITVNADGTGDFATVQAAVDSVGERNTTPTIISIQPGTYRERVVVPRSKRFLTFLGEDAKQTVLTYNLYASMKDENGNELGTFRTPSVTIEADDFSAENITFENTSGDVGQALAVTVVGDRAVFRNCRFLGWQDTILDQTGRHYYENCYIAGHCDFIFGGGTAFFENCHIHCLDASYITAASTPQDQLYGYVFSNCKITGSPKDSRTYLGRPWRDYAKVVFLNTRMSEIIRSEGWHNWNKPNREKTAFYAEYNSTGPGANQESRVPWSHQLTAEQAYAYTLEKVLAGEDGWNPLSNTNQTSKSIKSASVSEIAAVKKKIAEQQRGTVYLFACSKEDERLSFLSSINGFEWNEIGGPFLEGQVGLGKQFIAPSIIQGRNNNFHMVWQTGMSGDQGFGYAVSEDLIHWSEQQYFDLMAEHNAYDLINPVISYDQHNDVYLVIWASTLPGNYYQAYQEDIADNPRLWYAKTRDFDSFTEAAPFIDPGYSVQKGVLFQYGGRYGLIHEDSRIAFQTLRTAFGPTVTGPWSSIMYAISMKQYSNPEILEIDHHYILYFDQNGHQTRGALITDDFNAWMDVSDYVAFPEGYHCGSVLKVSSDMIDQLTRLETASDSLEPIEPINAPFEMPQLKRPEFADNLFNIRDYSAVSDGKTDNTKAFSNAIAACADAGGGRVLVPAGKWFTGPIHLKSNIDLHLAAGSEIIFSDRFEDYLPVVFVRVGGIELFNYSPLIYARDCENVAVTGPGKLNGNADAWWEWKGRETNKSFEMGAAGVSVKNRVFGTPQAAIRPSFLCLMNCRNILLEGFTIGSGPNWTIHPVYCENVIIRRVNVLTDGPNNDGIDPDSCRNVLIEHCVFDTGDDCVVLKSGYNEDGWRVGRPTENVVMRHCFSKRGHGGLVIGSEMSGDVRNVYMHDCTFEGTDRAVRIKSKRGRGGIVENVWVRDIKLKDMQREAVIMNMVYGSDRNELSNEKPPIFRNIDIRNLTCEGAPTAILMRALEDAPIENVRFENIMISSEQGLICENVRDITFDIVSIRPEKGPVYTITNGSDVTILRNTAPKNTSVFLEVSGKTSSNIVVRDSDLSDVSDIIVFKDGARREAVRIQ